MSLLALHFSPTVQILRQFCSKVDMRKGVDFSLIGLLDEVQERVENSAWVRSFRVEADVGDAQMRLRGDPVVLRAALLAWVRLACSSPLDNSVVLTVRVAEERGAEVLVGFEAERQGGLPCHAGKSPSVRPRFQVDRLRRQLSLLGAECGEIDTACGFRLWFRVWLARADATSYVVSRRRILLVDDAPVVREIVSDALSAAGFAVDVTGDGGEALTMVAGTTYDLILMDLGLPTISGAETAAAIMRLPAARRTPILAMTASESATEWNDCLSVGMRDVLPKTLTPEQIVMEVRRWLPWNANEMVASGPRDRQGAQAAAARECLGDLAVVPGLVASGERAEARRVVHKYRGAAGLLGMPTLLAALTQLEHRVAEADADELEQMLAALVPQANRP